MLRFFVNVRKKKNEKVLLCKKDNFSFFLNRNFDAYKSRMEELSHTINNGVFSFFVGVGCSYCTFYAKLLKKYLKNIKEKYYFVQNVRNEAGKTIGNKKEHSYIHTYRYQAVQGKFQLKNNNEFFACESLKGSTCVGIINLA